jgi:CBS domain-containing protein
MSIGKVCNREVVVIERRESILDAAKLMREHHVGNVVVVEDRDGTRIPVGILSDRDLVVEVLAQALSPDAVDVGDLMSTDLLTARENDELLDTIKRMTARGVRRVLVLDDSGALVGILALDDLIELIAEQLADLVGLLGTELRHEQERRGNG